MQENEFEQNMQQQLEGLRMEPSGSLWQKIAVQVAQKNNRRRGWFFLSMLLIGLAGTVAYFVTAQLPKGETANNTNNFTEASAGHAAAGSVKNESPGSIQKAAENAPQNNLPLIAATERSTERKNTSTIATANNASATKPIRLLNKKRLSIQLSKLEMDEDNTTEPPKNNGQRKNRTLSTKAAIAASIMPGDVIDAVNPANDAEDQAEQGIIQTNDKQNVLFNPGKDNVVAQAGGAQQNWHPGPVNLLDEQIADTLLSRAKSVEKKFSSTNKWVASLFVSAGKSFVASENSKALVEDYQGSVGNGTTSGISNSPPPITKGLWSFAAGIQVERKLFDRLSITSGIQYRLFTTSNAIGEPAISPVANMPTREVDSFKSGNSRQYVSYFHQLSIPLLVTLQLSKPASREIKLSAGVNFSTLLAAKTLQYNAITNRYFESNSSLNSSSIGMSGLLLINLSGKEKVPFYIGPEWYYSLASIRNTGLFAGHRQNFLGVRLQYALGKK